MGRIRLTGATSGYTELRAANAAGNNTIILPTTNGGEVIVSDSSGNVNIDSGTFYVDASNNRVGVGISSPSTTLHVVGTGLFTGSTQFNNGIQLRAATQNYIYFDDALSLTRNGVGDRLTIDSSGRVGIGTSSPAAKLDVAGNDGIRLSAFNSGTGLRLDYGNSNGQISAINLIANGITNGSIGMQMVDGSNGDLWLGGSGGRSMTLYRDGKVGIGSTLAGNANNRTLIRSDNTSAITNVLLLNNGLADNFAGTGVRINLSGVSEANSNIRYAYIESATASGSNDHYIAFGTNSPATTPLERVRIDSSGRLLVGTSSSLTGADSQYAKLTVQGNTAGTTAPGDINLAIGQPTSSVAANNRLGFITFADSQAGQYAQIGGFVDGTPGTNDYPGRLVFSVTRDGQASPTERLRIGNAGVVQVYDSSSNGLNVRTESPSGTGANLLAGYYSATSTTTGTNCFVVFANGNVQNTNNSYGALSDIKLKENIVDAGSQWSDIKALQVRKYNFKEGQTHTQIGLVAQEVELVSPGLVTESPDRDEDGNDLGTVTKSVNYSVLYMKAVKALQEAMERIETLEAKVAALENA